MKSEDDKGLFEKLEELAEFSPIPLSELISELTGFAVIPVEESVIGEVPLARLFKRLLKNINAGLKQDPIFAYRPNEVGNKIEEYVKLAIENDSGMTLHRTMSSGYPDINASLNKSSEMIYVECKTYSKKTNQRTFYLSPGKALTSKVTSDGIHVYLSFEMEEVGQDNGMRKYLPKTATFGDLSNLPVSLKNEWNANNTKLYAVERMIFQIDL